MCAINGISWNDVELVARMNAVTAHRGPDGTRIVVCGSTTLGFNRLAIIDLDERAMQPMQSADGRFTIIFNGEIYNYRELRSELTAYPFKTESDTEVILAAYSAWGETAFSKLNGMFALALWDAHEERLVLARDQVGVKPLYYHLSNGRLIFSSEMKGILEAGVPRTINRDSFMHFMRLMYVPKHMTMFQEIQKLMPGHVLVHHKGNSDIHTYAPWPVHSVPQSYADAVDQVHDTVTSAIQRQLVSDRPIGVYLSGGIDSTVVLAVASVLHPAINTFSIGFEVAANEDPHKFNADYELAEKSAKHFGATHHAHILTTADVDALFPQMIAALDQPIGNATTLAQLYLAQKTHDTATVVLSGEGSDELFGGYERYRLALRAAHYARFIPQGFAQWLPGSLRSLHDTGVDRFAQLMFVKDAELNPLLRDGVSHSTKALFAPDFGLGVDSATSLMSVDERNWLVDDALLRADTMGMAASIEARVPFLDLEVRALAHALPREWKVDMSRTKKVLKDAFRAVLPAEVLQQPKRGWFSPGAKWLRRPAFVARTDEVFQEGYTDASALFDITAVRRYAEDHRAFRAYHYTTLWAALVFLAWAREYKATL